MNKKLENICRVCLNIGSRNIFEKSSTTNEQQFSIPAIGENVSSLDRLVEKLRYVTMLKVSEKLFTHHHRQRHHYHFSLREMCFGAFFFPPHRYSFVLNHQCCGRYECWWKKIICSNVAKWKKIDVEGRERARATNKQMHKRAKEMRKKMKLDQGFVLSTFVFILLLLLFFCLNVYWISTEYMG